MTLNLNISYINMTLTTIQSNINSNILMNTQFRSVPDGQYTQTIYTLLRDQKYHEVNHLMLTTIGHRYSQQ